MRILYITTIGLTMGFFKSIVKKLIEEGNIVDIATNEAAEYEVPIDFRDWGCRIYQIDTSRFPLSLGNFRAIRQLRKIAEEGRYEIVHCHTPVAAAITRIACKRLRKKGLKVIYTAHGLHFYDGAPLKNWLIFYPIEKWLSRYTDILITINKEDYERVREKLKAKKTVYIPGVGVDTEKFVPRRSGRDRIKEELKLPKGRILLLSVGELNESKYYEAVIRAIKGLDITYVIVEREELKEKLEEAGKKCIVDVRLVSFRNDIDNFYDAADIYILPSIREGLIVSLMEAMASSLTCLVGSICGKVDLVDEEKGGYLFKPEDETEIRKVVEKALKNRTRMGEYNLERMRSFDIHKVNDLIEKSAEKENTHLMILLKRQQKRIEIGVPLDAFLLMSVGELNENKNHSVIIRALGKVEGVHYVIAGKGKLKDELEKTAKESGVLNRVHFIGFRSDIPELYQSADVCVFPSIREGLGLAVIEGMASGLPVIVSDNRGTRGFVGPENGITCKYDDVDAFAEAIDKLASNQTLRNRWGRNNIEVASRFDYTKVNEEMMRIYEMK